MNCNHCTTGHWVYDFTLLSYTYLLLNAFKGLYRYLILRDGGREREKGLERFIFNKFFFNHLIYRWLGSDRSVFTLIVARSTAEELPKQIFHGQAGGGRLARIIKDALTRYRNNLLVGCNILSDSAHVFVSSHRCNEDVMLPDHRCLHSSVKRNKSHQML